MSCQYFITFYFICSSSAACPPPGWSQGYAAWSFRQGKYRFRKTALFTLHAQFSSWKHRATGPASCRFLLSTIYYSPVRSGLSTEITLFYYPKNIGTHAGRRTRRLPSLPLSCFAAFMAFRLLPRDRSRCLWLFLFKSLESYPFFTRSLYDL